MKIISICFSFLIIGIDQFTDTLEFNRADYDVPEEYKNLPNLKEKIKKYMKPGEYPNFPAHCKTKFVKMSKIPFSVAEMKHKLGFKLVQWKMHNLIYMQKLLTDYPTTWFEGMDAIPIDHNGMRSYLKLNKVVLLGYKTNENFVSEVHQEMEECKIPSEEKKDKTRKDIVYYLKISATFPRLLLYANFNIGSDELQDPLKHKILINGKLGFEFTNLQFALLVRLQIVDGKFRENKVYTRVPDFRFEFDMNDFNVIILKLPTAYYPFMKESSPEQRANLLFDAMEAFQNDMKNGEMMRKRLYVRFLNTMYYNIMKFYVTQNFYAPIFSENFSKEYLVQKSDEYQENFEPEKGPFMGNETSDEKVLTLFGNIEQTTILTRERVLELIKNRSNQNSQVQDLEKISDIAPLLHVNEQEKLSPSKDNETRNNGGDAGNPGREKILSPENEKQISDSQTISASNGEGEKNEENVNQSIGQISKSASLDEKEEDLPSSKQNETQISGRNTQDKSAALPLPEKNSEELRMDKKMNKRKTGSMELNRSEFDIPDEYKNSPNLRQEIKDYLKKGEYPSFPSNCKMKFLKIPTISWHPSEILHSLKFKTSRGFLFSLSSLPQFLEEYPIILIQGLDAIPIDHNGMRSVLKLNNISMDGQNMHADEAVTNIHQEIEQCEITSGNQKGKKRHDIAYYLKTSITIPSLRVFANFNVGSEVPKGPLKYIIPVSGQILFSFTNLEVTLLAKIQFVDSNFRMFGIHTHVPNFQLKYNLTDFNIDIFKLPEFYYPFVPARSLKQKVTYLFDAIEVFKNDIKSDAETIQKRLYVRAMNAMAMRIMTEKIENRDFYYQMYSESYLSEFEVEVATRFLDNTDFIMLTYSTNRLHQFFESLKKNPVLTEEAALQEIKKDQRTSEQRLGASSTSVNGKNLPDIPRDEATKKNNTEPRKWKEVVLGNRQSMTLYDYLLQPLGSSESERSLCRLAYDIVN